MLVPSIFVRVRYPIKFYSLISIMTTSQSLVFRWGIISTGEISTAFVKVSGWAVNTSVTLGLLPSVSVGYSARSQDVGISRARCVPTKGYGLFIDEAFTMLYIKLQPWARAVSRLQAYLWTSSTRPTDRLRSMAITQGYTTILYVIPSYFFFEGTLIGPGRRCDLHQSVCSHRDVPQGNDP